jgi:hypothetical protein
MKEAGKIVAVVIFGCLPLAAETAHFALDSNAALAPSSGALRIQPLAPPSAGSMAILVPLDDGSEGSPRTDSAMWGGLSFVSAAPSSGVSIIAGPGGTGPFRARKARATNNGAAAGAPARRWAPLSATASRRRPRAHRRCAPDRAPAAVEQLVPPSACE